MKNPSYTIPKRWTVPFFTIWTGQVFSQFGTALVQFALVWYLTQQTGSATVLATATLAALLPQIVLGPFAGALVDRWSRRLVMIFSDGSIALVTLGLIWLFASGHVQIWHIYALMALRSLGSAFQTPAFSAATPMMVPDEHLTRVSGLNQTLQGIINMVAPPAGALLISIISTQNVLLIDVSTAILAIGPLFFISIPDPVRNQDAEHEGQANLLKDLREGFAYLRAWPGLLVILSMALLINFLLTPTDALMPLLVTDYFHKGALEFGLTGTALGLGSIAGGLLLSIWGGFKRKAATSMMGIAGLGVGVLAVGLAPRNVFVLALVGMAIVGIMQSMANGPLMALVQSVVRPEMQGRVFSIIVAGATAMTPLGLLIAGPLSDAFDIRIWFWFGGVACLFLGAIGFILPAVMNVEQNHAEGNIAPAAMTSD